MTLQDLDKLLKSSKGERLGEKQPTAQELIEEIK